FFLSSRRRHTSSKRDWSSDVCSSDLRWGGQIPTKEKGPLYAKRTKQDIRPAKSPGRRRAHGRGWVQKGNGGAFSSRRTGRRGPRSEERRVGKECRSRGRRSCEKARER